MRRLQEADKSRFIKPLYHSDLNYRFNLDNIPSEDTLIHFFNTHDVKFNWQAKKDTAESFENYYTDLLSLFSNYTSNSLSKRNNKSNLKKMFNDRDDCWVVHENESFLFVIPLNHKCCIFFDSFDCGGTGAKWCIGYESDNCYWVDHVARDGEMFCMAVDKESKEKYMLQFSDVVPECNQIWRANDDPDDTIPWSDWEDYIDEPFEKMLNIVASKWNPDDVNISKTFNREAYLNMDIENLVVKQVSFDRFNDMTDCKVKFKVGETFTVRFGPNNNGSQNVTSIVSRLGRNANGPLENIILDFSEVQTTMVDVFFSERLEHNIERFFSEDKNLYISVIGLQGSLTMSCSPKHTRIQLAHCHITSLVVPASVATLTDYDIPKEHVLLDSVGKEMYDAQTLNKFIAKKDDRRNFDIDAYGVVTGKVFCYIHDVTIMRMYVSHMEERRLKTVDVGENSPLQLTIESYLRESRRLLQEADKTRFIKEVWDEYMDDPNYLLFYADLSIDVRRLFPDTDTIISWVNSGAADKFKIDWQAFAKGDTDEAVKLLKGYVEWTIAGGSRKDRKGKRSSLADDNLYYTLPLETKNWRFVSPRCWEAAVYMNSGEVGGRSAKWCIGYREDSSYWDEHVEDNIILFVLALKKSTAPNRITDDDYDIKVHDGDDTFLINPTKYMLEIADSSQGLKISGWRPCDSPTDILREEPLAKVLGFENYAALEKAFRPYFEKRKEIIKPVEKGIDLGDLLAGKIEISNGDEIEIKDIHTTYLSVNDLFKNYGKKDATISFINCDIDEALIREDTAGVDNNMLYIKFDKCNFGTVYRCPIEWNEARRTTKYAHDEVVLLHNSKVKDMVYMTGLNLTPEQSDDLVDGKDPDLDRKVAQKFDNGTIMYMAVDITRSTRYN